MLYEAPEGGTDVPKHVGVVKGYTGVFVVCASFWFYKYFKNNELNKYLKFCGYFLQ